MISTVNISVARKHSHNTHILWGCFGTPAERGRRRRSLKCQIRCFAVRWKRTQAAWGSTHALLNKNYPSPRWSKNQSRRYKEGGRGTTGEAPEGLEGLETRDPLEGVVLDEAQTLRNLADINWRTPPASSQFACKASQTNLAVMQVGIDRLNIL